jgi:hypothetical protein
VAQPRTARSAAAAAAQADRVNDFASECRYAKLLANTDQAVSLFPDRGWHYRVVVGPRTSQSGAPGGVRQPVVAGLRHLLADRRGRLIPALVGGNSGLFMLLSEQF